MNDTTNTDTTNTDTTNTGQPDAEARVDALAREAGTALRREPSPRQLARVHRAKRNHQIGQAVLGCFAVLAVGGGAFLLLDRDDGAELVPAEPPTTVPASSVPPTPSVSTVPDTEVTTLAPTTAPVATVPVPAVVPGELYLGNDDRAAEQVQRVVDLETLEELRTEPVDEAAYRQSWDVRAPRADSAAGIRYELGSWPGDDPNDGLPASDRCGRYPVVVTGGPAVTIALPEAASFLAVSDDGRYVLTIAAADCPVDGLVDPPTDGEQVEYEQEIRLFDADDPTAPGRLLFTAPSPERGFTGVTFSADGTWMALTHVLSSVAPDGILTAQRGLDVIELATGRSAEPPDPTCTIVGYGQGDRLFAGPAYVLTKACGDGVYVELTSLGDGSRSEWLLPGVALDAYVTVEAWAQSIVTGAPVFVATVSDTVDGRPAGRHFLGRGGAVTELPFTDARASFFPLAEIAGD